MHRVPPQLRRILLGSAFLMSVVMPAPALAEPALIKLGDVKGESGGKDHGNEIQVLSFSWGADAAQGNNIRNNRNEVVSPRDPASGLSTGKRQHKPAMTIVEPGKLEVPNLQVAEPAPSGSATLVVARGSVAKGQHIPMVKVTMRSRTYALQGVEVSDCTALADGTDSCSLSYQSLGQ
jgi:hypothetical protein